jgi:hypothetical protein
MGRNILKAEVANLDTTAGENKSAPILPQGNVKIPDTFPMRG